MNTRGILIYILSRYSIELKRKKIDPFYCGKLSSYNLAFTLKLLCVMDVIIYVHSMRYNSEKDKPHGLRDTQFCYEELVPSLQVKDPDNTLYSDADRMSGHLVTPKCT